MAKETINKMKGKLTDQEPILANYTVDKGSISKIYKELTQLNSKQINSMIKNQAEE